MKKKVETIKEGQTRSPNKKFDGVIQNSAGERRDIVELIKRDHEPIKKIILTLKDDLKDKSAKEDSFEEFAFYLKGHAMAEESTLYVAMKNFDQLKRPGFQGDVEHVLADQLLHEINGTADENEWLAKVKVLAEMVEHHIQEEESEILVQVSAQMSEKMRMRIGEEYLKLFSEYMALYEIQEPRHVQFKKSVLPPVARL